MPDEPKVLDSVEAWGELLVLAQKKALLGDAVEAARLMMRLFTEVALKDCELILADGAEAWLEVAGLTAGETEAARVALTAASRALGRDDFAAADAILGQVAAKLKPEPGPATRLALMALGIKCVVARAKRA
ncbi:MAG: hypothetical protein HY923_01130 [Elusimicrobia bacterium]|nr:hypothetical protein [Elusimicrobiota bacterium]